MLKVKQLWRDVGGISAVEFALIAPLMITLLLGALGLMLVGFVTVAVLLHFLGSR